MSQENDIKDVAALIAEAMSRTDEPRTDYPAADDDPQFRGLKKVLLGEVPEHLQHLYVLMCDLPERANNLKRRGNVERLVMELFYESLKAHIEIPAGVRGMLIGKNWLVYGFRAPKPTQIVSGGNKTKH